MTHGLPNLHALDAAYQPFPPLKEWLARTTVDETRWNRYLNALNDLTRRLDAGVSRRAYEIVKRAAAIDTGAIEGLYEVDRGFTFTVAMEAALWESKLAEKGEHVRPLFEAQLHAYDYILDLATRAEPLSEAAIRALHEEVCRAQATYRVITAIGPQEHPLPKGSYKSLPNHVRTRHDTDHAYAPVDVTPAEMARLVRELRSEPFLAAHPILQAAYAHYAIVVIHPFADGNGRVARALASAFTYRAMSMPIVVLSEHKNPYLDSLEAADQGNYQAFAGFMQDRSLETMKLVEESLRSASSPSAEDTLAAIQRLYVTRGGYTHEQVDTAGRSLVNLFSEEVKRISPRFLVAPIAGSVQVLGLPSQEPSLHNYRMPLQGTAAVTINMTTPPPANAGIQRQYWLEVPKDAAGSDDLVLTDARHDPFTARMDELVPTLAGVLQIRMGMFAERVLRDMQAELLEQAQKKLRG
ncbi:MAG TPA: Fic family protein [Candidatus Acidoferrum sp.]|nr:Fic family protein [Candidatus Acidoferrum sp.]